MRNCIRCSECVFACPMQLEPQLLMATVEFAAWEKAASNRISDCIECGICSYVCPSDRPLLDYIRRGKAEMIQTNHSKHER